MALSIAGLFTAFIVIAAVSAAVILLGGEKSGAPESGLGIGMMLTGAYFIISALVMPQFADIGRVYRLAVYAQGEVAAGGWYWPLFAIFALAAVGFLKTWREFAKRNEVSGS
jgi:predicted transporter